MKFEISELRQSTVWALYRMRDRLQLDPDYQRLGDIWPLDKRQLLLDTILNDFDIPKIYLHKFSQPFKKGGKSYDYAIIDGKQRLETLWAFIDGAIALADEFEYFRSQSVKAAGMKYAELGQSYPDLKNLFDSFSLAVVCVETDEIEMIEEMFSRLNEAAPLTAPEKRNAFGGPIPKAVRRLAEESFFKKHLPFPNKRYRHFDIATKILLAEHKNSIVDTKKVYLDRFVEEFSSNPRTKMPAFLKKSQINAARMAGVFQNKDPLLRQVGMVLVYYHIFRIAAEEGWDGDITRKKLLDFNKQRDRNRELAEKDLPKADYDLIEFDRYAQSPNDATAMKFRVRVMLERLFSKKRKIDDL